MTSQKTKNGASKEGFLYSLTLDNNFLYKLNSPVKKIFQNYYKILNYKGDVKFESYYFD